MMPEDPKPKDKPIAVGQGAKGPLQILAPATGDTISNTFTVDGMYAGGAAGAQIAVTLLYTHPGYGSTEQSLTVGHDEGYWSATFTGVSVVADRKYKVTAVHAGNSDFIDSLVVLARGRVTFEEVDPFGEP